MTAGTGLVCDAFPWPNRETRATLIKVLIQLSDHESLCIGSSNHVRLYSIAISALPHIMDWCEVHDLMAA